MHRTGISTWLSFQKLCQRSFAKIPLLVAAAVGRFHLVHRNRTSVHPAVLNTCPVDSKSLMEIFKTENVTDHFARIGRFYFETQSLPNIEIVPDE